MTGGDTRAGQGPFTAYNHHDMDWNGRLPKGRIVYGWCGFLQPTIDVALDFRERFFRWAKWLSGAGAVGLAATAVYQFRLGGYSFLFMAVNAAILCAVMALAFRAARREPVIDAYKVLEGGLWRATLVCEPPDVQPALREAV